jgi:hypothetical protein
LPLLDLLYLETLERIKTKLAELKKADTKHEVFGSSRHRYKLNPAPTENELKGFESQYGIRLPEGYRNFLLYMGNGGAGPYYGLEELESGLYDDLDHKNDKDLLNPSEEFPHREAWSLDLPENDDDGAYREREEVYFEKRWMNGALRICNYGCGIYINLVVKGPEHGNIWIDDRCNDGGIYPDRYPGNKEKVDFLQWYELWLDKSLDTIRGWI